MEMMATITSDDDRSHDVTMFIFRITLGIDRQFGKCAYLFSWWELDEKFHKILFTVDKPSELQRRITCKLTYNFGPAGNINVVLHWEKVKSQ